MVDILKTSLWNTTLQWHLTTFDTVGILSMIVGYAVLITFCKMGVL